MTCPHDPVGNPGSQLVVPLSLTVTGYVARYGPANLDRRRAEDGLDRDWIPFKTMLRFHSGYNTSFD